MVQNGARSMRLLLLTLFLLALAAGLIWYLAWPSFQPRRLTVAFLDVGQGDAILIESPTGTTVLVDGGPGNAVLGRLPEVMPWWDRSIDMIVPTHPDADHIAGLIGVLGRYRVGRVLQSSVEGSTATWRALESAIAADHVPTMIATRGQVFDLGGGASLEVLFPDRLLPHTETNTASIVARLVYGSTSFLLTGDSPQPIEDYLVSLDADDGMLASTILKAGHHGSAHSSSPLYVGTVDPQAVVYSRGCKNTYGFPASATVATFERFGIPAHDTCEEGTLVFSSDGTTVSLRTLR
ncbi:MAG TPA: MBL fold metallo-hydrolase [Candidatus Paceibacterota bacterium]|nr:MBL fold metallo-hydrolase [Candidatus Paceibacterota bacterium]